MLSELCREMSYVAVRPKYVVDSWSTVFWSFCKKAMFRRWSTAVRVASKVLGYGIQGSDNIDGDR